MGKSSFIPRCSEEVKAKHLLDSINMSEYLDYFKDHSIEDGLECFNGTNRLSYKVFDWINNVDTEKRNAAIALSIYYALNFSDPIVFSHSLYKIIVKEDNYDCTQSFERMLKLMNTYAKQSEYFDEPIEFKLAYEYPESGIINLPWEFIHPCNGYYELYHPNHYKEQGYEPYRFEHVGAKEDFNSIDFEDIKKLWIFSVNCVNGKITGIETFIDCTNLIQNKLGPTDIPELNLNDPKNKGLYSFNKYAKNYNNAKASCTKDSEYLNHLLKIHNYKYEVKFCTENIVTYSSSTTFQEKAYLFYIGEDKESIVVVYENDNSARATYIFAVDRNVLDTAIESIVSYFSSYKCNKRETLSYYNNVLKEHGVIGQGKIEHDNLYRWEKGIKDYLHIWLKKTRN